MALGTAQRHFLTLCATAVLIGAVTLFTTTVVVDSLGYTDIDLRDASQALIADFNTLAPIVDRLTVERSVSWTQMTASPVNLTRFSFGSSLTKNVFVLSDAGGVIDPALTVSTGRVDANTPTNDLLLRSIY